MAIFATLAIKQQMISKFWSPPPSRPPALQWPSSRPRHQSTGQLIVFPVLFGLGKQFRFFSSPTKPQQVSRQGPAWYSGTVIRGPTCLAVKPLDLPQCTWSTWVRFPQVPCTVRCDYSRTLGTCLNPPQRFGSAPDQA